MKRAVTLLALGLAIGIGNVPTEVQAREYVGRLAHDKHAHAVTQTKQSQAAITPQIALDLMKAGNERFAAHLESVNLKLVSHGAFVTVEGAPRGLLQVDCEQCPDAVPALVALACVLPERSTFTRIGILRHKESDRVERFGCRTKAVEPRAQRVERERTAMPFDQPLAFRRSQQAVDRRRVEYCSEWYVSDWLVHGMG